MLLLFFLPFYPPATPGFGAPCWYLDGFVIHYRDRVEWILNLLASLLSIPDSSLFCKDWAVSRAPRPDLGPDAGRGELSEGRDRCQEPCAQLSPGRFCHRFCRQARRLWWRGEAGPATGLGVGVLLAFSAPPSSSWLSPSRCLWLTSLGQKAVFFFPVY